jgi:hypothetical protein
MSNFVEEFQQRLASGEPFQEIADWYFKKNFEDQYADHRHYDDMSPLEQAFFDRLNESADEVIAELRARRAARAATDLAGRS